MEFNDRLKKSEIWSALILLALHGVLLRCVLDILEARGFTGLSRSQLNVIYYGVSTALTLLLMGGYLKRGFDRLWENFLGCLNAFLLAWLLCWLLEYAVSFLILSLDLSGANPNQNAINGLAGEDFGAATAVTVFLAPIVEECIFRGGLFCGIRPYSRRWAYIVSMLLFALYHVWEYAFFGDIRNLVFMLQYLPAGFVLCRCYEKSGSVWTGIFFHMSHNYLSMSALRLLLQS